MEVPDGVDLLRLVELLEPTGVVLLVAPSGGPVRVRGAHFYDGSPAPDSGGLELVVGLWAGESSLLTICSVTAEHGQSGLAVKTRGDDLQTLSDHAAALGLPVLVFPDNVQWADVYSVVSAALRSDTEPTLTDVDEDLFALADSIAGVFGASVAIEDLAQSVVGYSSLPGQLIDDTRIAGILGRRVPQSAASTAQYRQVYAAEGVVRFPYLDGEQPRAAIAVRAGTMPIGSIWALEPEGTSSTDELDVDCVRALERGAQVAARHLMRTHDARDIQARRRRSIFDAVLAGQTVRRSELAMLLDSDSAMDVTITALTTVEDEQRDLELTRLVARQYRVLQPRAVVSADGDSVYVLSPGNDRDAARRVAQDVIATVQSALRTRLCGGVSSSVSDPSQLAAARTEADEVVHCLRSEDRGSEIAGIDDVRSRLILLHCADHVLGDSRLRHPELDRMWQSEDGEVYCTTLLAWLDHGCSVPAAARQLHVHENTVRYRLSRVETRFGLLLDNPEIRLTTWLQLRAQRARAR